MAGFKILMDGLDATQPFTSQRLLRDNSYDWSIIIIPTGMDADYKITLQVSDDGDNFSDYKLSGHLIDHTKNEVIFDSILVGKFFRLKYDPNGNSTGTIHGSINLKVK